MGRILEARGDEAADILDRLCGIFETIGKDPETRENFAGSMTGAVQFLLRKHRNEVYELMALDDGVTVEEERGLLSAVTIPLKLLRLLNDPSVRELFFGTAAANRPGTGSPAASQNGNG